MRILICVAVALCCVAAHADCPNGRCSLNQPVRTVTRGTVQTVRTVTKGAVQVVTPPYNRGRCTNGRCKVR